VELRNILDFTLAEPSPAILVEVKKIRIDLSPEEKYDRGACVERVLFTLELHVLALPTG